MTEDLYKPDSNGETPDQMEMNEFYTHARNGKTYMVLGWEWSGDTDEWCVLHQRAGSPLIYSRTLRNFYGTFPDSGVPRFARENNLAKWLSGGIA